MHSLPEERESARAGPAYERRREVAAGIKEAGKETCIRDCPRVDDLEATVFGDGSKESGLKNVVTTHDEQISNLVWWNRATIGAVIVSLVK